MPVFRTLPGRVSQAGACGGGSRQIIVPAFSHQTAGAILQLQADDQDGGDGHPLLLLWEPFMQDDVVAVIHVGTGTGDRILQVTLGDGDSTLGTETADVDSDGGLNIILSMVLSSPYNICISPELEAIAVIWQTCWRQF